MGRSGVHAVRKGPTNAAELKAKFWELYPKEDYPKTPAVTAVLDEITAQLKKRGCRR